MMETVHCSNTDEGCKCFSGSRNRVDVSHEPMNPTNSVLSQPAGSYE